MRREPVRRPDRSGAGGAAGLSRRAATLLAGLLAPPVALAALRPAQEDRDGAGAARACEASARAADWSAARDHCEAALRALPEAFAIQYFLGFAHLAAEDWAAAGAAFGAFTAGAEASPDPGSLAGQIARALRNEGIARFRAGDPERALPLLRRAAAEEPADAEVSFWLGVALLDRGDRAGAEEALRVVVREAPETTEALFLLGRSRYDAGDHEEAETHLEAYLDAAPPDGPFRTDAHWMAGSLAVRSAEAREPGEGAAERAGRHFSAFLEAEPDGPRAAAAHYFLGARAADRGDCPLARTHYGAFLEMAPDDERAPEVARYLEAELARCRAPEPAERETGPGLC